MPDLIRHFFYSCHSKLDGESLSFCFVGDFGSRPTMADGLVGWFTSFS